MSVPLVKLEWGYIECLFPYSRTTLAANLANEIDGLDPTDILVLSQEVDNEGIGFGFACVNISVHALGPNRKFELYEKVITLNSTNKIFTVMAIYTKITIRKSSPQLTTVYYFS